MQVNVTRLVCVIHHEWCYDCQGQIDAVVHECSNDITPIYVDYMEWKYGITIVYERNIEGVAKMQSGHPPLIIVHYTLSRNTVTSAIRECLLLFVRHA